MQRQFCLIALLCMLSACESSAGNSSKPGAGNVPQVGAAAAAVSSNDRRPSSAQNGAILGLTTVSGQNGGVFALPNATVYLDGRLDVRIVSDSQGRYLLNPAPAGAHFLMAQKVDGQGKRLRARREVKVSDGQTQSINLLLAEAGTISGQVSLADNGPSLENIDVYFNNSSVITRTDRQGRFTLRDVPQGDYELVVNAVGYKQHIQKNILITGFTQTLPAITLELHNPGTLAKVRTLSGKVAAGSEFPSGTVIQLPGIPGLTLTDSTGQFVLPNIPPARYQVLVFRPGFLPQKKDVNLDNDRQGEFTLVADPEALPGEVVVTVRGTDNLPLSGVEVHLLPGPHAARTDDTGRINFLRVKPGEYLLRATKDRFEKTEQPILLENASQLTLAVALAPEAIVPTPPPAASASPAAGGEEPGSSLAILGLDLSTEKDSITESNAKVAVGRILQLYSFLKVQLAGQTILDKSGKNVTWASDKPEIATVDAEGVVTGKSKGKARITATAVAAPAQSASLEISVE